MDYTALIIYVTILLLGLVLWFWGLFLLDGKKAFKYSVVNLLIVFAYSTFWFNHSKLITGHDEYGIGQLFGFPLILAIHSITVFFIIRVTTKRTAPSLSTEQKRTPL